MADLESNGEMAVAEGQPADASPAPHTQSEPGHTEPASREPAAQPAEDNARYRGWMPPDAHERIIDGFHKRLDSLAWAHGLDPERVRNALSLADRFDRQRQVSDEPQPDARDERGEPFYSPQQTAKHSRWLADQIRAELREEIAERLGPIESDHAATTQERLHVGQINAAAEWPKFVENVEPITAAMKAARLQGVKLSLHDAYIQVVVPQLASSRETLEGELRKKILDELNNPSATVRRDVNPSRAASASRKSDSEMDTNDHIQAVVTELRSARSA